MGKVYKARDARLKRIVAIKTLSHEFLPTPNGDGVLNMKLGPSADSITHTSASFMMSGIRQESTTSSWSISMVRRSNCDSAKLAFLPMTF